MTTVPRPIKTPFADSGARHHALRFGMLLFLISLGVLFASSIVGFVVVRFQLGQRGLWPLELPRLPAGLWAGTAVIALSSITMHRAFTAARGDDREAFERVRPALIWTLLLAVVFVALQVACWMTWLDVVRDHWTRSDEWRFALMGFYVLSGLHAAHVLGGMLALAFVIWRFPTADAAHRRRMVESCTMYWHFLSVVWLILFALLLAGG